MKEKVKKRIVLEMTPAQLQILETAKKGVFLLGLRPTNRNAVMAGLKTIIEHQQKLMNEHYGSGKYTGKADEGQTKRNP